MRIRSAISTGLLGATAAAAIGVSLATGASAAPAADLGSLCVAPLGSLCSDPAPAEATITAVVQNNTDATMYYSGGQTADGHWVDAPAHSIAPHTTETVAVASNSGPGVGVSLDYSVNGWWGHMGDVTVAVNNYQSQTNTFGTTSSPGVQVDANFVHGSPDARYIFNVR